MNKKMMIIAGEASGDLHGSGLVRELKFRDPDLDIFGIGGDRMKKEGMQLLRHINEMSVLGFLDVIKQFRFFRTVYHELVKKMEQENPAVLVLIDYPGMNLKLAKAAHKRNIKVLYYIAPQVWAWGAGRIKKMDKYVNRMAVIIPFEERMFRDAGIDATFVGHPLLEVIRPRLGRKEFFDQFNLNQNSKTIGLLPGSRSHEVNRLLPEMIKAVKRLKKEHRDIQVVIGKSTSVSQDIYQQIVGNDNDIQIIETFTYDIMKHCDLLIVASGTATLESALFETPLIIVYKVDSFSYFIGRMLVKIEHIGLVNVIAEQKIVPEFIQGNFEAKKLLPEMKALLYNEKERQSVKQNLIQIKERLGEKGASAKTADMIMNMAKEPISEN